MEYDPLLSKLITWGSTRVEAIRRMYRALTEYRIHGIKTTIPFFKRLLFHPEFIKGNYNTHFIEEMNREITKSSQEEIEAALIAAGIHMFIENKYASIPMAQVARSNWKIQGRLMNIKNRF